MARRKPNIPEHCQQCGRLVRQIRDEHGEPITLEREDEDDGHYIIERASTGEIYARRVVVPGGATLDRDPLDIRPRYRQHAH